MLSRSSSCWRFGIGGSSNRATIVHELGSGPQEVHESRWVGMDRWVVMDGWMDDSKLDMNLTSTSSLPVMPTTTLDPDLLDRAEARARDLGVEAWSDAALVAYVADRVR